MQRLAIFCLFVSFFFCYLEWSGGNSAFVYEVAYSLLFQKNDQLSSFSHPLVLLPFLGQLIVLVALVIKQPKRWMILTGTGLMGTLVLMVLISGLLSGNWKIILSTVPFILFAVWGVRLFSKKRKEG